MIKNQKNRDLQSFKSMNFDHLMSIYETNYLNFKKFITKYRTDYCLGDKNKLIIDNIFFDKYTKIFRMYHKFPVITGDTRISQFSIKTHLIFYMYDDAKLLEVKSLKSNKIFDSTLSEKLKLNLNLFYWLKFYINQ